MYKHFCDKFIACPMYAHGTFVRMLSSMIMCLVPSENISLKACACDIIFSRASQCVHKVTLIHMWWVVVEYTQFSYWYRIFIAVSVCCYVTIMKTNETIFYLNIACFVLICQAHYLAFHLLTYNLHDRDLYFNSIVTFRAMLLLLLLLWCLCKVMSDWKWVTPFQYCHLS